MCGGKEDNAPFLHVETTVAVKSTNTDNPRKVEEETTSNARGEKSMRGGRLLTKNQAKNASLNVENQEGRYAS